MPAQLRLWSRERLKALLVEPRLVASPIKSANSVPWTVAGFECAGAVEQRFAVDNPKLHESAFIHIDVDLGELTQTEFEALHAHFGGRSDVAFVEGRTYKLQDMLPPAIRRLVGMSLLLPDEQIVPGTSDWPVLPHGQDKSLKFTTNCHGTSYMAMRAYLGQSDDLALFFGDAMVMENIGDELEVVAKLEESECHELSQLELQPGDLVMFFEPDALRATTLLHSAVYVGGGLFFEKPDTEHKSAPSPYRLATAERMTTLVADFIEGPPEVRVVRPTGPLEDPATAFSAGLEEDLAELETRGIRVAHPLVSDVELGMGGGVLGIYPYALCRLPIPD